MQIRQLISVLFAVALLALAASAQTTVSVANYNFSKRGPFPAPNVSIASGAATFTFTAALGGCPRGVNGTDANHRVLLSGGTGATESVLITGGTCTSGASSGTIAFTAANAHSGAYSIGSLSTGLVEAYIDTPTRGSTLEWCGGTLAQPFTLTIISGKALTVDGCGQTITETQTSTTCAITVTNPGGSDVRSPVSFKNLNIRYNGSTASVCGMKFADITNVHLALMNFSGFTTSAAKMLVWDFVEDSVIEAVYASGNHNASCPGSAEADCTRFFSATNATNNNRITLNAQAGDIYVYQDVDSSGNHYLGGLYQGSYARNNFNIIGSASQTVIGPGTWFECNGITAVLVAAGMGNHCEYPDIYSHDITANAGGGKNIENLTITNSIFGRFPHHGTNFSFGGAGTLDGFELTSNFYNGAVGTFDDLNLGLTHPALMYSEGQSGCFSDHIARSVVSGGLYGIGIHTGGTGYHVADVITVTGGGANATATVAQVSGSGLVQALTWTSAGTGYAAGSNVATTGGFAGSSGLTVDTTVDVGKTTCDAIVDVDSISIRTSMIPAPVPNNVFFQGTTTTPAIKNLIGVDGSNKVSIDSGAIGAVFGGAVTATNGLVLAAGSNVATFGVSAGIVVGTVGNPGGPTGHAPNQAFNDPAAKYYVGADANYLLGGPAIWFYVIVNGNAYLVPGYTPQ